MKKLSLICFGLLLALATSVSAGPPPGGSGGPGGPGRGGPKVPPLFLRSLVQPDTIMRHQSHLELSVQQRKSIQAILRETRGTMADKRWSLAAQTETIRELLAATPIDQQAAIGATEQLFNLETAIKTQHLQMLIQITNVLSPKQLKRARRMQRKNRGENRKGPWRNGRPNLPEASPHHFSD